MADQMNAPRPWLFDSRLNWVCAGAGATAFAAFFGVALVLAELAHTAEPTDHVLAVALIAGSGAGLWFGAFARSLLSIARTDPASHGRGRYALLGPVFYGALSMSAPAALASFLLHTMGAALPADYWSDLLDAMSTHFSRALLLLVPFAVIRLFTARARA